jgi:hypothetical protein
VARIIQQVARVLNVEPAEAELVWPKDHSAVHSIRIGAAHYLAATGIDLTSIMHSGGWGQFPKLAKSSGLGDATQHGLKSMGPSGD